MATAKQQDGAEQILADEAKRRRRDSCHSLTDPYFEDPTLRLPKSFGLVQELITGCSVLHECFVNRALGEVKARQIPVVPVPDYTLNKSVFITPCGLLLSCPQEKVYTWVNFGCTSTRQHELFCPTLHGFT
jgi:hypothetical protein